jgi:hypothetical protein
MKRKGEKNLSTIYHKIWYLQIKIFKKKIQFLRICQNNKLNWLHPICSISSSQINSTHWYTHSEHLHTLAYTHKHAFIHSHTLTHTHPHTPTHTHTCTHSHTHTLLHIHLHTLALIQLHHSLHTRRNYVLVNACI